MMPHDMISPVSPPGSRWFPISFRRAGLDWLTVWLDRLAGGGPGRSGVLVGPGELRVRMGDFRLAVPRSSVRSVARSHAGRRPRARVSVLTLGRLGRRPT